MDRETGKHLIMPTEMPRERTEPQFSADENPEGIPTPDTYHVRQERMPDFPLTATMQLREVNNSLYSMHDRLRQILDETEAMRHEARRRRQPVSWAGMVGAVLIGMVIAVALIATAVMVSERVNPDETSSTSDSTYTTPADPRGGGTSSALLNTGGN